MSLTLGSLFDGIGGFPLAGSRAGIVPVWASEIDKSCQKVTAYHFPDMVQLGDITKLDGRKLSPVDIITGGSPCQDLSVAGKQAGLKGERSGLFLEMMRIVNEMRSEAGKPRYVVWENVPGAFSSNRGEDFKSVLEAFVGDQVPMPRRWEPAGLARGRRGCSCWRVLDAQYFGVPQRRRRIFLVHDFRGERSREVLFESEGVPGDTSPSREAGEGVARCLKACSNLKHREDSDNLVVAVQTNQTGRNGLGVSEAVAYTLDSTNGQAIARCVTAGEGTRNDWETCTIVPTLRSNWRNNSNPVTEASMLVMGVSENQRAEVVLSEKMHSLSCRGGKPGRGYPAVLNTRNFTEGEISGPIQANSNTKGVEKGYSMNCINPVAYCLRSEASRADKPDSTTYIPNRMGVRRLTPTECERLQGYPDGWTALEGISDSARYRMLGNSVAVPVVEFLMRRLAQ